MHVLDSAWQVVKAECDAACLQAARAARWELTNDLNQLLRRLRQYHGEGEWLTVVLESVSRFVAEAAVFEITGATGGTLELKLRAQHHLSLNDGLTFPLSAGSAFESAFASRDPVVAMRLSAEVTEHLRSDDPEARAHVLPIINTDRVVALLFAADREYVDVNALEVIAGVASMVLERGSNRAQHTQVHATAPAAASSSSPAIQPVRAAPDSRVLPAWADLPLAERDLHLRAQRFARVAIAELELAKPEASRAGRAQENLYIYLKSELDRAREQFRAQFMKTPSMVDYLHLEFVRYAAEGDESKLGAEYPGPLV